MMVAARPPRPLIICDIDGVLLRFFSAFEAFLVASGYAIALPALTINKSDGGSDDVGFSQWIARFYRYDKGILEPVAGAAEALQHLAARADIILLSNAPEAYRSARLNNLARYRLDGYPLHAGQGPKGAAVHALWRRVAPAPLVFIDDLGSHISAVRDHCPQALRILFNEDARLGALAGDRGDWHLKSGDWAETHAFITAWLDKAELL